MAEYIELEAAIAVIGEKQKELCPVGMYSRHAVYGSDREKFDEWQEIIDTLESIPAADVRPVVRGKWINQRADSEMCSACGVRFYISALFAVGGNDEPNFCPNCGADMRAEEGET